jgi:hypothetical protein
MAGLATLGFVGTNYNNVCNKGDWTRIPVLTGQCFNAIDEGIKYNSTIFNKAQVLYNNCDNIAKTNKLFKYSTKAITFVKKHINPLIVASSAIKVALANKEDRTNTLLSEGGCVAGMFLGEGWMKKNLNKYLVKLPVERRWLPIIKGVVFVTGSITASTIGQKLGKSVAKCLDKPSDNKNAETPDSQQTYTPLNMKA